MRYGTLRRNWKGLVFRARLPLAFLALWSQFAVTDLRASMEGMKELVIDFTKPEGAHRARWSTPEILTANSFGVGWDGPVTSRRGGWIQTEPVAIAYSWRPVVGASITARIAPTAPETRVSNGQVVRPEVAELYVRYSADAKNWSSWQPLRADEAIFRQTGELVFQGALSVPNHARQAYEKLLSTYGKLDVPWASDEDAAVRWILSRNPRFFETELPFIGYVQFLYEGYFYGGRRLTKFSARIGWGLSGIHHPPKDPSALPSTNEPWKFRAEGAEWFGKGDAGAPSEASPP